jgi:hypothetical protein
MEGEPREYYEKKIQQMIREMEEEINTLEYKIEEADFDSDIGYKRPVVELRFNLEEVKKAAKKAEAASDASWQEQFRATEDDLKVLGDRLKRLQAGLQKFLLE